MPRRRAWHGFAADVGAWDLLGFGGWAIEETATGAFAGQVGLSQPPHFPEREIGWLVFPASRAAASPPRPPAPPAPSPTAPLGWTTAVSYVDPDNARSIALARRLGCTEDPRRRPLDPWDIVFRHPAPEARAMTRSDAIRRAADLLRGHRESIDRLDAILVFTLAERFKHTQAVGVLKAQHGLPPSDPAREVGADRPARAAGRGGRPRPGVRPQIPELHHLGSDQAPREASRKRAARPTTHTQGD